MKNLKYILFSLFVCIGLNANAQGDSAAEEAAAPSGEAIAETGAGIEAAANVSANQAALELFATTANQVGISSQTATKLQQLRTMVGSFNTGSEAATVRSMIESEINSCSAYSSEANKCCGDAATCSAEKGATGLAEMAQSAMEIVPTLLAMFGGENAGGFLACAEGFKNAMDALGVSKTESSVCAMLREGAQGTVGCKTLCSDISSITRAFINRAQQISDPSQQAIAVSHASILNGQLSKISESSETCVSGTASGESDANQSINETQQMASQAMECASAFASEETPVDEVETNPIDPADVAGLNSNGGGAYSKTAGDSFGGLAPDLPEDTQLVDESGGADSDSPAQAASPGIGGFGGGAANVGGANGNSAAASDAKRKRGVASKKGGLISGYGKASKAGGSGYSGNAKAKLKFAQDKAKKEKEDAKAGALNKLLASMGVPTNSQDNIFERVSKKFEVSSVKEKLFDAKLNKKSWVK